MLQAVSKWDGADFFGDGFLVKGLTGRDFDVYHCTVIMLSLDVNSCSGYYRRANRVIMHVLVVEYRKIQYS